METETEIETEMGVKERVQHGPHTWACSGGVKRTDDRVLNESGRVGKHGPATTDDDTMICR